MQLVALLQAAKQGLIHKVDDWAEGEEEMETDDGLRWTDDGLRWTGDGLRWTDDGLRWTDDGLRWTDDGLRWTDA